MVLETSGGVAGGFWATKSKIKFAEPASADELGGGL